MISKKIVSEDEGDEDFDLDVAFNEKNSDSKSKSDGERPLPQGTIRVKAKSSSNSPSSLGGKKEKRSSKEQRGSRDNLAFDPLAGSISAKCRTGICVFFVQSRTGTTDAPSKAKRK